jgi:Ca-activated chloride channel family protein
MVAAAAMAVAIIGASQNSPESAEPQYTLRVQVNEVHLVFTATDKSGRPLENLTRSDVAVLEDGKTIKDLSSFERQTDLPLRITLLVDNSDSVRYRLQQEKQVLTEFLERNLRPSYDRVSAIDFGGSRPHSLQTFTADPRELVASLDRVQAHGATPLYDAVVKACEELSTFSSKNFRKAILVLSDGDDTISEHSLADAIATAQTAEVPVFTIGIGRIRRIESGKTILQIISEETGGRAFEIVRVHSMQPVLREIEQELRSYYALAFKTDFNAGVRRTLSLIPRDPKVHLRYRSSYYQPYR